MFSLMLTVLNRFFFFVGVTGIPGKDCWSEGEHPKSGV